ncbi:MULTISPECIES: LOG family protein [unclassified Aureimonas]|uniref:LOG family protein n=1 Tax=unclassified Aureimonas TaxID=2615206 RepID=UPI0006F9B7CF|nr:MULTISPECIES: LOG family protein [unclassified Aureimonas]KQT53895.1 3-isopropylmalate dehydrogenase [Aureimonas sp. Leaf427]KQT71663.1 3-isopropylmalate dehydrogenase [Aureimonas sp. Leaf460]
MTDETGPDAEAATWDPFPSSGEDRTLAKVKPDTPQTRSPTFRLAYDDAEFLTSEAMRGVRLQLELMKPEMALTEAGILSTVVLFGGARIPAPGAAAWAARNEGQRQRLEANSRYYEEARRFAQMCSKHSANTYGGKEFVVVTGGGPGVMEAGNRGAADVGAVSIALNITLPHEQAPNAYATPELCFNFHYFAVRKMHFLLRAKAMAIFPGGFGTLDELFEALTLIQTGRMAKMPVILFGSDFWARVLHLDTLAEEGMIAPDDVALITFADTAEDGWAAIRSFYGF